MGFTQPAAAAARRLLTAAILRIVPAERCLSLQGEGEALEGKMAEAALVRQAVETVGTLSKAEVGEGSILEARVVAVVMEAPLF